MFFKFFYEKFLKLLQGSEEAGVVEQLKSQICDNIALYAQKYDEEFQQFLPQFVTDVWGLLVNTSLEPKYDLVRIGFPQFKQKYVFKLLLFQLVSNALQFLSSVAEKNQYRQLFEDNNVLSSICEKVVIPNMEFRSTYKNYYDIVPFAH